MANSVFLGTKTVATAGTRVSLVAASQLVTSVYIQAKTGNTGLVYVGDSTVTSTKAIQLGVPTATLTPPGVGISSSSDLNLIDLKDINLDVSVSGDGVNFFYFTR